MKNIEGFLKQRGPVKENLIDRTLAIRETLLNPCFWMERKDGRFTGYLPEICSIYNIKDASRYIREVVNRKGFMNKKFDYYFESSENFNDIRLYHIFDAGEGIEERECTMTDYIKNLIIGHCLLIDVTGIGCLESFIKSHSFKFI
ncbi:hypothetical protein [Lacrimispora amygdalina]|uniref:hypothetical protein n=1 Tax=Lacrimispora amygdalina TaxID=253257 RepID=UPI000BE36B86|nr:hypothetical protein [Lacrimispora amygdalina]